MVDEVDQTNAKVEKQLEVRPTVFVGLGGTGMEVLLRLRRRILQHTWGQNTTTGPVRLASPSELPVAEFLYFDTDTSEARETGRAAATDIMGPAVQFSPDDSIQHRVNVGYYQNNARNLPQISDWLPTADLSKIDTSKGAGQVRPISRLLFFVKYGDFIKMFQEKATRVVANVSDANDRALKRLGLTPSKDLRVVVVSSTAGGTGSGSFIDVGYALRSVASPKAAQVDLFLMLPGGYTGANEQRVKANTFAALMELEYVMRNQPEATDQSRRESAYVERWTEFDENTAYANRLKPYSDVFLLDTANIKQERTDRVTDLYEMAADILFEDFGSSDFAQKKRSVSVNQEEKKAGSFFPKLPPELGQKAVAFSKSFSSIGQCTVATKGQIALDTAIAEAGLGMVESFFGIASAGPKNIPTTESRDEFLSKYLKLGVRSFEEFPDDLPSRPSAISEFELVSYLLLRPEKASLQDAIAEQMRKDFQGFVEGFADIKDWPRQAEEIRDRRKADVDGKPGTGDLYGVLGREILEAKANLLRAWKSDADDASLKSILYSLLDDHERGGLDYTISLVEQVKLQIDDRATGAVTKLTGAAEQYGKLADFFLTQRYAPGLSRLRDAAQSKSLLGSNRKTATKIVDQLTDDLRMHLLLRIRAIACIEAASMLREISAFLGERQGLDERGRDRWSGLLAEFTRGYDTVSGTLDFIRGDVDRLKDARDRPQSGMYLVIDDKVSPEIRIAHDDLLQWARDAFEGYKGSRALFSTLRTPQGKFEVLTQIQAIAARKLARFQSQVPTVTQALLRRPENERRDVFAKALTRALPWIDGSFDNFQAEFKAELFKLFVAVANKEEFETTFREEIPTPWPGVVPNYVESGVPGRIVVYCELSGVPLDVLTPLRSDWRRFYQQEYNKPDGFPLHNHRNDIKFPSPVAPTPEEVRLLRLNISIFLRAVVFGILKREASAQANRPYLLEVAPRDFERVGSELRIKRRLFDGSQRNVIEEKLQRLEEALSPIQLLAASALFAWNAEHAYPKRREGDEQQDKRVGGLMYNIARELEADFLHRYEMSKGIAQRETNAESVKDALFQRIADWTEPVRDSVRDVDPQEANLNPNDPAEFRAQDKRAIRPEAFTDEHLLAVASTSRSVPIPTPVNVIGVPTSASFYVAVDGETRGPYGGLELGAMVGRGELASTTLVYDAEHGDKWVEASTVLGPLFTRRNPSRPPPPPPPSLKVT